MAKKKISYRVNVYNPNSMQVIDEKRTNSLAKLKSILRDAEASGFEADFVTLENGKRKYGHNETLDSLEEDDGTSGQDRKTYSDTQDRKTYSRG
jgi:hypothetical protein